MVYEKMGHGIFRKNYSLSYEAIHDDCVVAFTGGYEKIATENQTKRVNVDKWYSSW